MAPVPDRRRLAEPPWRRRWAAPAAAGGRCL